MYVIKYYVKYYVSLIIIIYYASAKPAIEIKPESNIISYPINMGGWLTYVS